jgi:putative flippase GtrA
LETPGRCKPITLRASLFQFFRFGAVGLFATAIHAAVYAGFVEMSTTPPMLANLWAFICAFAVSFFGHFLWTFRAQMKQSPNRTIVQPLIRFLLVALAGATLNMVFVFLCEQILDVRPVLAVAPMMIITPIFTFVMARQFAFKA